MSRGWTAAVAILSIGACGLVVSFQGWRARGPDADVVGSMVRTVALVERGHIPRRGTLTDHNSFRPPGTSWLALPGVLLFADPRLVELTGSGALYLATLPGVFLIGRHFFGFAAGMLATLLFGFSAIPLDLAGHLWPRGHPFFCVWMVYCAALWVERRDGRWLAAACVLWAAGMYVHMEMSPFILILPALWWYYRPPVNARAMAVAAAVAVVMWSPYLAFQWSRGFIDLQSQLFSLRLEGRGIDTVAWCGDDPLPNPAFRAGSPIDLRSLTARIPEIADLMLLNVETRVPGGEFILLALLGGGLVTAGAGGSKGLRAPAPRPAMRGSIVLAGALIASSILATELALRWIAAPEGHVAAVLLNARRFHVWLLVLAGVVLARNPRVWQIASDLRRSWRRGDDARVPVIAILVPAAVLLLFSEAGVNRMLGIWPLQVILISAFAIACRDRLPPSSPWRRALLPLVAAVVVANLLVLSRTRDWFAGGWAGRSPDQIEASDFRLARCEDERQ